MTLSIQTRCPHCFGCFNLPAAQLDQAEAKGRCGQCQQIFLVNDHLIVSADKEHPIVKSQATSDNDTANQPSTTNQDDIEHTVDYGSHNFETGAYKVASYNSINANNTSLNGDSLNSNSLEGTNLDVKQMPSHDSTDMEHSAVDDFESDLFESHNVWQLLLDQAMTTDTDNFGAHKPSDAVNNPPASTSVSVPTKTTLITDTINNSTDSHISSSDNAMTDDKFIEDEHKTPTKTNSTTNLTHLLTGKNTLSDQKLEKERIKKAQARMQPAVTNPQTPVASVLWLAGCLVLVLLLFAQYVIFNLNTLIKNPAYAARLQTVCSIVVCSLPNADLAMLNITQLSYGSNQVNTGNSFSDIKANLINNGTQAQLLPSLEVSVYNSEGLLGVFIAMPEDYLLSNQNQLAGETSASIMFTIPVAAPQIHQVTIDTIY